MSPEQKKERLVVIAGPTAAGKSGLAVELAISLRGEIINADSAQVYKGFDIGTDTPDPEARRGVPHHLLSFVEPEVQFNAADFVREALRAAEAVLAAGHLPFIVGGTGLYLRALLCGLFPGPGRDDGIRARLDAEAERDGIEALHGRLMSVDPVYAAKTGLRDRVRIVRALEVFELTGKPFSAHFAATRSPVDGYSVIKIGVTRPRPELYARIEARVDAMFGAGLVAEVEGLLARGVSPAAPPFKALGYWQVLRHLSGELTLDQAVELTKTETRQYAKRQLTWFRKMEGLTWFDASDMGGVADHVRRLI